MSHSEPFKETSLSELSHFDADGRARMVDVTSKEPTVREATARGRVLMKPSTLAMIEEGRMAKGDVLAVAQVAGIMAAKRTPDLVPMCHPLPITGVEMQFQLNREESSVEIAATVRLAGRTGVEMEALTAVSVAALTVYDMCKAVDREMVIDRVRLVHKSGGKSGDFTRQGEDSGLGTEYQHSALGAESQPQHPGCRTQNQELGMGSKGRYAILTVSDKGSRGEREDRGGPAIRQFVADLGGEVAAYEIVPDEKSLIQARIVAWADQLGVDVVLTTGGTGLAPRDVTPTATLEVIDYEVPGIAEAMRAESLTKTPHAMLSRMVAGVRGRTLVINLPGSPRAVRECLEVVKPALPHAVATLRGEVGDHPGA